MNSSGLRPPYSFSLFSQHQLKTLHHDLQAVLQEAILHVNFRVLEGHRNEERQRDLYFQGKSKLLWPHSRHNFTPSRAVDIAPYPIDWNDRERFYYLGGVVMGLASGMGIPLRWGGDWNTNGYFDDQTFDDLAHFELTDE